MYFITYNLTVFFFFYQNPASPGNGEGNISSFSINEISKLNMPKLSSLSLPFLFKLFYTGTLFLSKKNNAVRYSSCQFVFQLILQFVFH
jgi:hypothetical protein